MKFTATTRFPKGNAMTATGRSDQPAQGVPLEIPDPPPMFCGTPNEFFRPLAEHSLSQAIPALPADGPRRQEVAHPASQQIPSQVRSSYMTTPITAQPS